MYREMWLFEHELIVSKLIQENLQNKFSVLNLHLNLDV